MPDASLDLQLLIISSPSAGKGSQPYSMKNRTLPALEMSNIRLAHRSRSLSRLRDSEADLEWQDCDEWRDSEEAEMGPGVEGWRTWLCRVWEQSFCTGGASRVGSMVGGGAR